TDAGLANFKGCTNLELLELVGTQVTDAGLAPFEECKHLTDLILSDTEVSNAGLAHFKDMSLTRLNIQKTKVTDLSPLKGMPLKILKCDFKPDRDAEILRSIKTLESINDRPAKKFLEGVPDKKP